MAQVASVAYDVAQRVDLTGWTPDGVFHLDLRNMAQHDFFFTTQAFMLLHIWIIWASVRLARQSGSWSVMRRALVAGGWCLLVTGHALAIWLAGKGTGVGLW